MWAGEGWCQNQQAHVCGPLSHTHNTNTHITLSHTHVLRQSIEYRFCCQVDLDSWSRPLQSCLNSNRLNFLTCERGCKFLFLRNVLKTKLKSKCFQWNSYHKGSGQSMIPTNTVYNSCSFKLMNASSIWNSMSYIPRDIHGINEFLNSSKILQPKSVSELIISTGTENCLALGSPGRSGMAACVFQRWSEYCPSPTTHALLKCDLQFPIKKGCAFEWEGGVKWSCKHFDQ